MNYWKRKRLCRKTRTKELKPKDGYNRFNFAGNIFLYLEQDIHILNPLKSHDDYFEYVCFARDDNGKLYEVVFYRRNGKYFPFAISDRYGMF